MPAFQMHTSLNKLKLMDENDSQRTIETCICTGPEQSMESIIDGNR